MIAVAWPHRNRRRAWAPLWAGATAWSPGPELKRIVSSVGDHHISRSQQRRLAALEPVPPAAPAIKPVAGKEAAAKDAASKTSNPWDAYAHANPAGPVEGDPESPAQGHVACGPSNGSWESTGPPSGVIWRLEVLQHGSSRRCPIRRHRIPWQRNGVTFSLNT